jgi:hypothetical protein
MYRLKRKNVEKLNKFKIPEFIYSVNFSKKSFSKTPKPNPSKTGESHQKIPPRQNRKKDN